MDRYIKMFGVKSSWQRNGVARTGRQFDVKNRFAFVAIKMAMLVHVRAKSRRSAVQGYLPYQAGFDEGIQAVINSGMGNLRHLLFRPDEDLIRRGMIALMQQHVINLLPLGRKTEAVSRQTAAQSRLFLRGVHREESTYRKRAVRSRFRINLNSTYF
jgi:hypothetical protein